MSLRLRAYKDWTYTGFTMTYLALGKSKDLTVGFELATVFIRFLL